MKLTTRCILILAIALVGMAQPQPKEPKASTPKDQPKITAEMRETFFQAKADLLEAQAKLADAQKRMQDSVTAMQAVCQLTLDPQGKPQCAPPATSEAAKAAEKK
jgi:hypothetical protein